MRIAVSSQNFRTVTGHAGRARRFIVFEADGQTPPREVERLDLPPEMAFHGFNPHQPHPLDSTQVLITGGAGEGLVRHLAQRGVRVVATAEADPRQAVEAFFAGRIQSPGDGCDHDDDHSCAEHACTNPG